MKTNMENTPPIEICGPPSENITPHPPPALPHLTAPSSPTTTFPGEVLGPLSATTFEFTPESAIFNGTGSCVPGLPFVPDLSHTGVNLPPLG